ncbi:SH3 domain-containing protein [Sphingomonas nostoxanthinifaciens]|uniref:SH3 domain-containing protein n=1 Tax=Sphingomonas nostoxanthinifaciens TaxID=2872652 RepID=UPI001CC1DA7C|nr:SH3 domain-containing protein [Sphingomonas nostoxanthinifaciens]UAK23580.1 hypothetical protein K8P63_14455 [Sphingomonas nostoxanthinifaciens]
MRGGRIASGLIAAAVLVAPAHAQERKPPYWASIAATEAILRAGPDRSYPALWVYKRRDLPVRVLQMVGPWRRVQEQDGTSGWMLAMLLSARRTATVTGVYRPIRDAASDGARLLWQAEPGVVGRITHCDGQWCRIRIDAREGYIAQSGIWGTDTGETVK